METEFGRRLAPHGLTRMSYAVLGAMVFDGKTTPSASIKVTPEAKTLAKEMQEHSRAVNAHFVEALKPEDKDRFVEHV
ncbi:MAG: hypothetical protein WBV78_00745, partial [Roseobacter sp.]